MKDLAIYIITLFILCSGCSGLGSDGNEVNSDSYYNMIIEGLGRYEGTETEWNLSSGIAVIGPEETGEPLARLEFTVRELSVDQDSLDIIDAILSWSNLRMGDASEIDARLYALEGTLNKCISRSINTTNLNITGAASDEDLCFIEMVRIDQNGSGEVIDVGFNANVVD